MIGCLRTHVRKQPIIALYFDTENELKFYDFEDRRPDTSQLSKINFLISQPKTNVVGTQKNRLNETVRLSTKTNAKTE